MTNVKNNWIKYTTETGLECAYLFEGDIENSRVKIITKVPRGHYYSARNEALEYFSKHIVPTLKIENHA